MLIGVAATWACAQAGPAATGQSPGVAPAPMPVITPEAKRFLLDPKLFTPDDRWKYDASDKHERPKARFGGAIAAQKGTVSIGDTRWLNTGAYVLYQVYEYPSVSEARQAFRDFAPPPAGRAGRQALQA